MGAVEGKDYVLQKARETEVKFVQMQFIDVLGNAKSCEIPFEKLEKALYSGIWFDGSSIEGFVRIHESDMLLKPDENTFAILPWTGGKVARIMCDVFDSSEKPFEGDPRFILKKQLEKAKEKGFDYRVGPELEFFLFPEKNGGVPEPHDSAGYFDLDPRDLAAEAKREIVSYLQGMGLEVEMSHHEVAAGQHEIDFKYANALSTADHVLAYKSVLKTVAKKYGLFASFMPKPIFGINGSGMHVHQSLWEDGSNSFFDDSDEYKLSKIAYGFIAGQLSHARALAAVVAPTVNSYKRLVPGYEAPVYICWARRNRSALIRVPEHFSGRNYAARTELRCPDPSCNPYLAFAAMLAAGLDGIERGLKPPEPVEEDVYEFDDAKLASFYIRMLPASLDEATQELCNDSVLKESLGKHAFEKLVDAQRRQWDEYHIRVTGWEIENYLPVL
ncbi:glutamine synthetase [Candidatus Micrarchaeota archaeon]|nr:glutamine synthetase [Candidatus Micrarchaeota archaeon]